MADDTQAPETPEETGPRMIPYERFQQVYEEKKALASQVEELAGRVGDADALRQDLAVAREQYEGLQVRSSEDLHLASMGLDGEARDLMRWAYGRLPEENRPALTEWADGIKADPTTAPKALSVYFSAPVAPEAPEPPKAPEAPKAPATPPNAGVGGKQPDTSGQPVSAEALRAAREKAERSGDWSAFETLSRAWMEGRKQ